MDDYYKSIQTEAVEVDEVEAVLLRFEQKAGERAEKAQAVLRENERVAAESLAQLTRIRQAMKAYKG